MVMKNQEICKKKLGYKDEGVRRKKYYCLATKEYKDECITGLQKKNLLI